MSGGEGQVYVKGGTFAGGAEDFDGSVVLGDDFGDDGEAESVALGFRGEIGSKNLLDVFRSDAATGIGDRETEEWELGIEVGSLEKRVDGSGGAFGDERECAFAIHGLEGIHAEIDEDLHDLDVGGVGEEGLLGGVRNDLALFVGGVGAQEQSGVFNQRNDVDFFGLGFW